MKHFLSNKEKKIEKIHKDEIRNKEYDRIIRHGVSEKALDDFRRPAYTNVNYKKEVE